MRHLLFVGIAVVAALVSVQVPVSVWEKLSPWIFVAALLLLVIVLVPFIGKGVNGARRWIPLGFMSFQPSELTKLAIAMYAAGYMVRRMDVKENFFRAVVPMAISIAVVGLLLLAEPDMGAFLVIATIAMGILFLGGVNGRMFMIISAVLVGAFVLMITLSDWRRERIFAYLNPWDDKYTLGKAYQLSHSLIAFGRGARSSAKGSARASRSCTTCPRRTPIPARGDRRGARLRRRRHRHRRLLLAGAALVPHRPASDRARPRVRRPVRARRRHLVRRPGVHQHGREPRVLPTKGLTLPLMSYGGSAIVMNLIALAIVIRVDIENRQLMRGGRA